MPETRISIKNTLFYQLAKRDETYERQVDNDGDALPHGSVVGGHNREYLAAAASAARGLLVHEVGEDGTVCLRCALAASRVVSVLAYIVVVVETAREYCATNF